jgi:hypothetical protein
VFQNSKIVPIPALSFLKSSCELVFLDPKNHEYPLRGMNMAEEMMGDERNNSKLITAEQYHSDLSRIPLLKSGDKYLDQLLGGGFRKGLVHLLIGSRKKSDDILMKAAVIALKPRCNGGLGVNKVAYVDGDNHFSPYFISKIALSMKMDPNDVLSRICVARAFNWSQMVEIAEVKLSKMQDVGLILIAGLTSMFEVTNTEHSITEDERMGTSSSKNGKSSRVNPPKITTISQKPFDDLKSAINGIKKAIEVNEPIVIITARKNDKSLHKPVGGKFLTHFGCVIVDLVEHDRYIDYILIRHPFMAPKRVIKWNQISDKLFAQITDIDNAEFPEQKVGAEINSEIDTQEDDEIVPEEKIIPNPEAVDLIKPSSIKPDSIQKKSSTPSANDSWNNTIQHPDNNGWIWKVMNLRLREKRKRANLKSEGDRTQSLTLDFYTKGKQIKK